MVKLNFYLNFNGTTEAAFNFYKSVFGGELMRLTRFKDTQHGEKLSAEDQEKIMHVSLPIGQGTILMANDVLESMGQKYTPGNNFYLSLSPESEAETDRLFQALSAGGKATMPMRQEFWGAYFGMLTDPFGVRWMINYDPVLSA